MTNTGLQGSDLHDYGFPGLAVSADGSLVAFTYDNLPVSGSNAASSPNVYLRDRQARTTRWISAGMLPALSGDGRFLAFVTYAALRSKDTEGGQDVYVLDRNLHQFERVSVTDDGTAGVGADTAFIQSPPSLSIDGQVIAFETTAGLVPADDNNLSDIYLRDRQLETTTLLSASQNGKPGNGELHFPSLSADATTLAFASLASNLITDDTNGLNDIFLFHRTPLSGQPLQNALYFPLIASEP